MGGPAIVVFSDLVDSTALLACLGDDRMELVRRAHVEYVRGVVGRVIKTLGDGAMASFESAPSESVGRECAEPLSAAWCWPWI